MPMKLTTAIIAGIIIALAGLPAYYFYTRYEHSQTLLNNPELAVKEERNDILARVGKLVDIPTGEDPTVATISDKDKLKDQIKNQPFFTKAENGDKVLVFTQAKKAILYRPSINKVMDMVAISLSTSSAAFPGVVAGTTVRVAIYNGTTTPRLANTAEKTLTQEYDFIAITKKDNAGQTDYPKTIVVDLNGTMTELADTLAKKLQAEIKPLPAGETKPDADILVIIGNNYQ